MSTTIKATELDADYCKERLLTHYLSEGATVYTLLRSVSASGMSRHISLLVAKGDEITDITYYAAGVLGESLYERNGHRAIRVNGCGMDMGFHLVYNLASVLFAGEDRAGSYEYALSQRWI